MKKLGKGKWKLDWINFLFLSLCPLVGVILYLWHLNSNESWIAPLIISFVFYFLTGLSITAGYHRLFAHRSYSASPILKFFYLFFGAGAFQNSALKWSLDHRRHHQQVDTDLDPYNAKRGFWWSHIGWVLYGQDDKTESSIQGGNDLTQDSLVMWQHRYIFGLGAISGFLLPLGVGFLLGAPIGALAMAGFLRVTLVQHCTFFINSLAHMIGSRPYSEENSARDNKILALLTFGEGHHNFHHKFQIDYRNGHKWYHFDPSKWLIGAMSFLGLAWGLRRVPASRILQAKMLVDQLCLQRRLERRSQLTTQFQKNIEEMKFKVTQAQLSFENLKKEYQKRKRDCQLQGQEKLRELQYRLRLAQQEFEGQYRLWKITMRYA